jgi:PEP-CTERM motif
MTKIHVVSGSGLPRAHFHPSKREAAYLDRPKSSRPLRPLILSVVGALAFGANQAHATAIDYTGAIQTYTIATTGLYQINEFAAQGGNGVDSNNNGGTNGGMGAMVTAYFDLNAGDVRSVLVGGAGANGTTYSTLAGATFGGGGGGGGGSFVYDTTTSVLLEVAGGGGGGHGYSFFSNTSGVGQSGSAGQNGVTIGSGTGGLGGIGGSGGAGGFFGGGGGGYSGAGGTTTNGTLPTGGSSFIAGGAGGDDNPTGGSTHTGGTGGFGGGGGGGGLSDGGGGGGGGYSGGGGGPKEGSGGGGGSYVDISGTNPILTLGGSIGGGNGEVNITLQSTPSPVPEPGTVFLLGSGLAALTARRRKRRKV